MTEAKVIPPERLRSIAQNKLAALSILTFESRGTLFGHLSINPGLFQPLPGITLGNMHTFAVQAHDHLRFGPPSPFQFVGPIEFQSARTHTELQGRVAEAWKRLVGHTEQALAFSRRYAPGAKLNAEHWTVEVLVTHSDVKVQLRVLFDHPPRIQVIALNNTPISSDTERLSCNLPEDPGAFDLSRALARMLAAARASDREEARANSDELELDLELSSEDLGALILDEKPVKLDDDGPLSLDIEESQSLSLDMLASAAHTPAIEIPAEALGDDPFLENQPQIEKRLPRLPINLDATLSWDDQQRRAHLKNANYGGLFASVEGSPPPVGAIVTISGIGALNGWAEVRHHRTQEEGELFGTSQGVGLMLVDPPDGRAQHLQAKAAALLFIADEALAAEAARALAKTNTFFFVATNLLGACLWVRYFQIGHVIVDQANGVATEDTPETAAEALGDVSIMVINSIDDLA